MDTQAQFEDLNSFPSNANAEPLPAVALKLGLSPQERPVSHLQVLIEQTLAPHIHVTDSRVRHPLVDFDVEGFVNTAIDALSVPVPAPLERESSYPEAA